MSLKEITLQFPEETVEFKGGEFVVRGLSLSDIVVLVGMHRDQLNKLFAEYAAPDAPNKLDADKGLAVGISAIQIAPALVAHIIALAEKRDEGEAPNINVAIRLPVDVQIDAIAKIIRMTFQTEGGPKKVLETVVQAIAGTMQFAADLKT